MQMIRKLCLAGAVALGLMTPAFAQTYKDTNGTTVFGVVPLNCPAGGGPCTGPSGGSGGSGTIAIPYSYTAVAGGQYNQAATTASTLTVPTGALYARICAVGGQMNFVDSTNGTPTTGASPTVGTPLSSGSCILEQGATVLAAFQLINAVASTGTWTAVYFK